MQACPDQIDFLQASAYSGILDIFSNVSDTSSPGVGFKEILAGLSGGLQICKGDFKMEDFALLAADPKLIPGNILSLRELQNLIPMVIPVSAKSAVSYEGSKADDCGIPPLPSGEDAEGKQGEFPQLRNGKYELTPSGGQVEFAKISFNSQSVDHNPKSQSQNVQIIENHKKDTPFAFGTIGIDRLIDFLGLSLKGAENGEKGGNILCQNLVSLTDLENLEISDSIELTFRDDYEEKPVAIKIAREDSGQMSADKSFACYRLELSSHDETIQLKSVLVKNESNINEQNDLKGLNSLIEKNRGHDAQLIVFIPRGKMVYDQNSGNIRASSNPGKTHTEINIAGQIDSSAPLHMAVKSSKLSDDIQQMKGSPANSYGRDQESLSGLEIKSSEGQAFSGRQEDMSQNNSLAGRQAKAAAFSSFIEKQEAQPIQMAHDQNGNFIKGEVENKFTEVMRDPGQFRQVEFKFELPREGLKLSQGGYFRIKLEPEMLGKIDVQLKVINDRLVAYMEVDKPLARQVVEANLPQLKETLQSHGIRVENIMINLSGEGGFEGSPGNREMANRWKNRMRSNSRFDPDAISNRPKSDMAMGGVIANLKGRLSFLA